MLGDILSTFQQAVDSSALAFTCLLHRTSMSARIERERYSWVISEQAHSSGHAFGIIDSKKYGGAL